MKQEIVLMVAVPKQEQEVTRIIKSFLPDDFRVHSGQITAIFKGDARDRVAKIETLLIAEQKAFPEIQFFKSLVQKDFSPVELAKYPVFLMTGNSLFHLEEVTPIFTRKKCEACGRWIHIQIQTRPIILVAGEDYPARVLVTTNGQILFHHSLITELKKRNLHEGLGCLPVLIKDHPSEEGYFYIYGEKNLGNKQGQLTYGEPCLKCKLAKPVSNNSFLDTFSQQQWGDLHFAHSNEMQKQLVYVSNSVYTFLVEVLEEEGEGLNFTPVEIERN